MEVFLNFVSKVHSKGWGTSRNGLVQSHLCRLGTRWDVKLPQHVSVHLWDPKLRFDTDVGTLLPVRRSRDTEVLLPGSSLQTFPIFGCVPVESPQIPTTLTKPVPEGEPEEWDTGLPNFLPGISCRGDEPVSHHDSEVLPFIPFMDNYKVRSVAHESLLWLRRLVETFPPPQLGVKCRPPSFQCIERVPMSRCFTSRL